MKQPGQVLYRVGRAHTRWMAGRLPTDGLGEIRTAFDWRNFAHRVDVNKRNAIPRARCQLIDYQFHRVAGLLRLAF